VADRFKDTIVRPVTISVSSQGKIYFVTRYTLQYKILCDHTVSKSFPNFNRLCFMFEVDNNYKYTHTHTLFKKELL